MTTYALTVDGRSITTVDHMPVRNPATGEAFAAMPMAEASDLDAAVEAARRAFPKWAARSDADRASAVARCADAIEANAEDLARLLTMEQGKPLNGLGSRFEIGGAVAWTRATAALSLPIEEGQGFVVRRKPIGVVGSITPWNWPVMIACWHVMPAVRAGNTVVIKPSPFTPLSTLRLVELLASVLPPGVLNVVTGADDLGARLTSHPDVGKVVFTGSTPTGRRVMRAAADTLKRLTLELGGNDVGIVLPDCDPKAIAEGLFWGAFVNSGQTCAALKRLYVHDRIHDAVCDELARFAAAIPVGDGLDERSILGPVQNARQYDVVASRVADAVAVGGRVILGGNPVEGPGWFYPTTLVADVRPGCALVDLEQFGPALPIIRFDDVETAIAEANADPLGLGGSIWSADLGLARDLAARLDTGSAWINAHGAIRPDAPFGGVKQSGLGVEFGLDGLKEFTVQQTIHG